MTNLMNIADIIRNIKPTASKNEIKVLRAKLRRAGITNHAIEAVNTNRPYTLWAHLDTVTDIRAENPQIVIDFVANLIAA